MFQRSRGARMAGTVFNSHHRGQRDDKTEAWWPPYLCDPLPEQIVETAECACLARQSTVWDRREKWPIMTGNTS